MVVFIDTEVSPRNGLQKKQNDYCYIAVADDKTAKLLLHVSWTTTDVTSRQ